MVWFEAVLNYWKEESHKITRRPFLFFFHRVEGHSVERSHQLAMHRTGLESCYLWNNGRWEQFYLLSGSISAFLVCSPFPASFFLSRFWIGHHETSNFSFLLFALGNTIFTTTCFFGLSFPRLLLHKTQNAWLLTGSSGCDTDINSSKPGLTALRVSRPWLPFYVEYYCASWSCRHYPAKTVSKKKKKVKPKWEGSRQKLCWKNWTTGSFIAELKYFIFFYKYY